MTKTHRHSNLREQWEGHRTESEERGRKANPIGCDHCGPGFKAGLCHSLRGLRYLSRPTGACAPPSVRGREGNACTAQGSLRVKHREAEARGRAGGRADDDVHDYGKGVAADDKNQR